MVRAIRTFAIAVIAVIAATGSSISSVSADPLTLAHPLDDAFVVSDPAQVDLNFGSDPMLLAWANYPNFGARSYVKFALPVLPVGEPVTFARLQLFQFEGGGYSSGVDVFRVADDTWTENAITWNEQPVLVPEPGDLIAREAGITGFERGWIAFDLIANGAWNPAVDLAPGDRTLSLIVRTSYGEVGTQRAHQFCSSDAGSGQCLLLGESSPNAGPARAPQLVIGMPEPTVAGSLAAGAGAIFLFRRWTGSPRRRRN